MTSLAAALLAACAAWLAVPAPPRRGALVRPSPRRRLGASWTQRPASRSLDVAAVAAALASELRAGRTPPEAWDAVIADSGRARLPAAAVPGAEPTDVLRRWSRVPGWGGLGPLSICWRLADSSGAGLADALDRLAVAMRHEHEVGDEVSGQLASVRATAWVLATVPVLAVAMGQLVGADPVSVLLGTPLGLACLTLGAGLAAVGWWWLTRQVESVRRTLRW